ncbi:30478_t:CDS:2, partial [Racocetra persica]
MNIINIVDNNNLSTSRKKNKITRKRNPLIRKCNKCKRSRSHKDENAQQCNFCDQIILSGNEFIDDLLIKLNKKSVSIEFIPYEQFSNITYLAKGGFSEIYKATCSQGIKGRWNSWKQEFKINNDSTTVVLESLNDSQIISNDFLNELKNYFQCSDPYNRYIRRYYGITQHPETKNYMIVMAFAPD